MIGLTAEKSAFENGMVGSDGAAFGVDGTVDT